MAQKEIIASLETIVQRDVSRDVASLGQEARGGLFDAARSIADCPDPVAVLMTGAFMPWAEPPAAETDGPVGVAELATGLRGAGTAVRVATDSRCEEVVRIALAAADPPHDIPLDVIPVDGAEAAIAELAARYRDDYGVTHAIAVERLGPADDGRVYDMSGRDVSAFTAPLHRLFDGGPWKRIGIGDGGNELGMGSLSREAVATAVSLGERIHCSVPCDHLIVSATSNWGAQALLAAVAVLQEDRADALLAHLSAGRDIEILREVVLKGPAVDGVTQTQTPSVDGVETEELARMVSELLAAVGRVDAR
jgi:hypothetical protein